MHQLFQNRAYRKPYWSWNNRVHQKFLWHQATEICANKRATLLINNFFSLWAEILDTKTLVRFLTFTNSVKMRLQTRYIQSWQMRKSVLRSTTQSQQTSRLCIEYSDLSECRVSDNLHVVCDPSCGIIAYIS